MTLKEHIEIYPVTYALIAISIVVGFMSDFDGDSNIYRQLYFTNFLHPFIYNKLGLPEVFEGQVWRLFTPMFLHSNFIHLLFNCLWIRELGVALEGKFSSLYLFIFVCLSDLFSNIFQHYYRPLFFDVYFATAFGGLSGVVYALLGFLWIRGRVDASFGIVLNQQIVVMMLIWFFLCLFGIIPNVANGAHAGGLIVGALWGYLSGKYKMRQAYGSHHSDWKRHWD